MSRRRTHAVALRRITDFKDWEATGPIKLPKQLTLTGINGKVRQGQKYGRIHSGSPTGLGSAPTSQGRQGPESGPDPRRTISGHRNTGRVQSEQPEAIEPGPNPKPLAPKQPTAPEQPAKSP